MKVTLMMGVCAAGLLLVSAADAGGIKRIKKEKDFRALVADKKITIGSGWAIIKSDGTSVGEFEPGKWKGVWKWSRGYYCTNGTLGGVERGSDCKLVKSDGNVLVLIDNKGKGERELTYQIEN